MRRATFSIVSAAAIAIVSWLSAGSAANAITVTFTNVPLSDGGVLNGSFSTNVYGQVGPWNLVTSGGTLPSETYAPSINEISAPAWNTPITLDFFANTYAIELQLTFTGDVNGGNVSLVGGLGGPSFECFNWSCQDGKRYILATDLGNDVAFTPLPATWLFMLSGLLGLGAIVRYRAKPALAAA